MKIYKVKREQDEVYVILLKAKSTHKFHFINLTKEHICPCEFNTIADAEEDLSKYKREGKVIEWEPIKNFLLTEERDI